MKFLRNVVTLGGGSVAAQVVSILAVPIITRLYDPGTFGTFSIVQSVVAILFPIATLRLNAAALLPKTDTEAAPLMAAAVIAVVLMGIASSIAIIVAPVEVWLENSMTSTLLWYLPVGITVFGLLQCMQFWRLRTQRFGLMAAGQFLEALSDRAVGIGWALLVGPAAVGLVTGRAVSGALHIGILLRSGGRRELRRILSVLHPRDIWRMTFRYRGFPLYSTPAFLFANGAREFPIVILGAMFSPAVAGLYGLAVRILNFPMLIIGDAVAKVFLQRVTSAASEKKSMHASTGELFRVAFYLMLPPNIVIMAFGPYLFSIVFGPGWLEAGWISQILALSFFSAFIYRVLSAFFDAREKQSMRLLTDLLLFSARVIGLMIGGLIGGIGGAIQGMLIGTLLVHIPANTYLLGLAGIDSVNALRLTLRAITCLSPTIIGLFVITHLDLKSINVGLMVILIAAAQTIMFRFLERLLWTRVAGYSKVTP